MSPEARVFNACDTSGYSQTSSVHDVNEPVHVITASDHDEATRLGLAVFVSSLFAASDRPELIRLTVVTTPESASECRKLLSRFGDVSVVAFQPERQVREGLRAHGYRAAELSNLFNFARFFLPTFTPADKVLFADPDVVWLSDVVPLVQGALRDTSLPIASRQFNCTASSRAHCASHFFLFDRLNIGGALRVSRDAHIFNAGFFITSLEYWRQHQVTDQLLAWAALNSVHHFFVGGSQPPMLLVFPSFERLPDSHNIPTPYVSDCPGIEARASSVHYVGPSEGKPWNKPDAPYAKPYHRAIAQIEKRLKERVSYGFGTWSDIVEFFRPATNDDDLSKTQA